MLDDVCYFACQSVVTDFFLMKSSYSVHLLRPFFTGVIVAKGKVEHQSQNLYTASAQLFDEAGKLLGSGQGQFLRSKMKLEEVKDYVD